MYKWVMAHINESCRMWRRHTPLRFLQVHLNMDESWHTFLRMSHVTYERVMAHINKSNHIWMRLAPLRFLPVHLNIDESWHIFLRMSPVTYEWGMSHMNESCHVSRRLAPPRVLQVHFTSVSVNQARYGVATISRPLEIIGLFCRIQSLLKGSFAKETYNFKESTHRSHPIFRNEVCHMWIRHVTHGWVVS